MDRNERIEKRQQHLQKRIARSYRKRRRKTTSLLRTTERLRHKNGWCTGDLPNRKCWLEPGVAASSIIVYGRLYYDNFNE